MWIIAVQSVVRSAFENSGFVVWVYVSAHQHTAATEIWDYICGSLVAVCGNHDVNGCRHVVALYKVVVVYVVVLVGVEFLVGDISLKSDAAQAVRGIHVGVVECSLYGSCTVVYRYIVGAWSYKISRSIVECDV